MASRDLDEIIRRAELLAPEEQLLLIARLAERARQAYQNQTASPSAATHQRKWAEIRGHGPYPMVGEDAQQWVSRSRHEANEHRDYPKQRDSGEGADNGMSGAL